ncbi:LytR/AlgR family response regulator transcription factor [Pseudoflavitalea rhizosphaerae]|uniref:LytR/AlgR family response regulator transcription factor n=1 Tax=Pseudoflavitalea rhizosphaerae TaxID=1884793 RepID=UPI000F8F2A50|nr:response regulator transcription factor [Pseudoflavitalea rhizosphaerae]
MLRCLAVDDEMLSLDLLEDNIRRIPFLQLVGKCSNAFEALSLMQREPVDLIFLDIQMPGLTGVQFLESLASHRPMVIFVTAYKKYALDGFDLDVLDYLVKPVPFERFVKAVNKAAAYHNMKMGTPVIAALREAAQQSPLNAISSLSSTKDQQQPGITADSQPVAETAAEHFFVNVEYNLVRISFREISFIEGLKDYVKIHLHQQPKPVITRMSMKSITDKLPVKQFMRVHKSYIISMEKISSIRKNRIYIGQFVIPVSDSYKDEFFKRITPEQRGEL